VFASLLGTWEWLTPTERALVRGFVLNKFRGDEALLAPAPALLEDRTGVPVLGVVPFLSDLRLPEEDAASLSQRNGGDALVEIAVVRVPHLANFDEFGDLAAEPGVHLRYVSHAAELRAPDLVILPGTKTTIPDLLWLTERGLTDRIRWLSGHGTPLIGICGGYQMLGTAVHDPDNLESGERTAAGLGLLNIETDLATEKRLVRTRGQVLGNGFGVWRRLAGLTAEGYEIHAGRSRVVGENLPFMQVTAGPEGGVATGAPVVGTHVHGLLERPELRQALVQALAASRGFAWHPGVEPVADPYDMLADVLEAKLRLDRLRVSSLGGSR
jgi:adenosylcobyric acid synthase